MLATLAGIASASGCLTTNRATDSSTGTSRTTTTETSTLSRTASCNPPSTDVNVSWYEVGQWHTVTSGTKDGWLLTASSVELTRTFHHEKAGETYRMPDDEQLAVVTSKVGNPTSETDTWESGEEFVVIPPDGAGRAPVSSLDHPEGPFRVANLERVGHSGQYTPEGYVIESGRIRRLWWVTVVPRDLERSSLQVGFDSPGDPEVYDVRWLSQNSC